MANLYWLDQIQPHHQARVGNKALYLSQLLQKGFSVVPGFVVSERVLHQFLDAIDWSEPLFADLPHSSLRLDIENPRQLQTIAQRLRQSIELPALPTALLTELNAAMAQLQASVLVLRPSLVVISTAKNTAKLEAIADGRSSALFDLQTCQATETDLTQGLKRLWAQLFRAKSLFYWQRLGIPLQQVKLAVLVQPLRSAIASGTVQRLDKLIQVRSTTGLGMAIDWGEVSPDVYQVDAASGMVQAQQLGKRAIVYQVADYAIAKQDDDSSVHDRVAANAGTGVFTRAEAAPHMTPLLSHPHDLPLLQAYLPDETQRAQFSLSKTQFSVLMQLVRQVIAAFEPMSTLEWTLYGENGHPPQFYLTQMITVSATSRQPYHPLLKSPPQPAVVTNRAVPSEAEPLPLAPATPDDRSRLIIGLAAAPGHVIGTARVIAMDETIDTLPPGTIVVAEMLPLQGLLLIQQAIGIVLEQGGMTSHSAIIAREIGVPAVLSATHATKQIQTGEWLLLDGDRGSVHRLGDRSQAEAMLPVVRTATPASVERPLLNTKLMVNLSQVATLDTIATLPIDGIGLLRGELLALAALDGQHPLQWLHSGRSTALVERLADRISQFAAALSPRPVFYRSLDLRSHESRRLPGGDAIPIEVNPTLGLHGTFSYCLDPTLFDLELAALAQVQATYPNIHLLLPFVRTVEEFIFCRERVQQAGLMHHPQFQLWMMAEVPSVLFLLPEYVSAGVQGIAIGTNDLTQLLLGADRDHATLASAFGAQHPAVKAAIAHLIQQATQLGIPCSICGHAPSRDPNLVEALVRWGITSISVEPAAVEATYWAIARAERRGKG